MLCQYKKLEKQWQKYWAQFILDNPNKPWNWDEMSRNPNITPDIIQQNLDKDWNWRYLSMNENITWDIIEASCR